MATADAKKTAKANATRSRKLNLMPQLFMRESRLAFCECLRPKSRYRAPKASANHIRDVDMRNSKFLAVVLLALLVVPTIAKAQNLAAITGSVTDRSGGAIVGAGVKLVDTRIRATHEAKTGADGTYRIVDIPPGPGYTLTVSKDGFQTFQIGSLYLPVASTATQDVRLEIGTIDQTMEVTAQ